MKHKLALTASLVLCLCSVASAAERDAVVKIESKNENGSGLCSGVCVSPDGYILTAEHCVHHMKDAKITVSFGDKSYSARIAYDPVRNYSDEASLLKVDTNDTLPFLTVSKDAPRVGDKVHSIGFPDGKYSESSGVIISVSDIYIQDARDQFNRKVAGTAYATNVNFGEARGNSGGPLFNESGEVVAISSTTGPDGAGWIGHKSVVETMQKIGPQSLQKREEKPVVYAFTPDY